MSEHESELRHEASAMVAALGDAQRVALKRHGYRDDLPPRGLTGPPEQVTVGIYGIQLRNRVCELDGIVIDGHEPPDEYSPNECLHCDKELTAEGWRYPTT